jgi:hypothetical protein
MIVNANQYPDSSWYEVNNADCQCRDQDQKNKCEDRLSTGMIIRHVIVPPRGKPNWERLSSKERERWLATYDRYDGLKNAFKHPQVDAALNA